VLSILEENGAPIRGIIMLRPDPNYILTQTFESHKSGALYEWRKADEN